MRTPKPRRRKPSKAAFARAMAQVRQQELTAPQRSLPADLASVIDQHQPASPAGRPMNTIRPFLHQAIAASGLQGKESVRKHCTHLTELARYALSRGLPLEVTTVLTTAIIDEFIRVDMAEAGDHLRAERRRRLLWVARAANPGPTVPAKLAPVGHSAIKACYTPNEIALIARACRTQPTDTRRRELSSVVALGAGAGADSVDLRALVTDHIEDLGDDGILVHFQAPRPRIVPLRARYEHLMRSAVADRKPGELLIGSKQDRRNTAGRVIERAALHNVPHIEPARLRATWLADLMTDPIPLAVILQAAGLKSARTLSELQPHLQPWAAAKGFTMGSPAVRGEMR